MTTSPDERTRAVSSTADENSLPQHADPRLTNADLAPVPLRERKWGAYNFTALWLGMVHNIFGFTVIGTMMATGLSAVQALTGVGVACLIQLAFLVLTGRVGSRFGIPFPVWARSAFGVFGANVPAILRGLTAIGWFGVQNYLGATVLNALFAQVIPAWGRLGHHEVFGLGGNLWICLLLFWSINFVVVRHGMDTIRRFEAWAGPAVLIVMSGLVVWALVKGHGLGPVFHSPSKYKSSWAFVMFGLAPAVALFMNAGWITMILNYPDVSRFAKSNRAQSMGTLIGLPLGTILYYGMSAIIVSGTQAAVGKTLWNPGDVLTAVHIPVVTIIGALLLGAATISVNIPANLVSPAYDLNNLWPRLFTFKRAAVVCIVLAFAYMPWIWMENSARFYDLLDNAGTFLGPATGILVADFFVIRRGRLDVPQLYRVDGRYGFQRGFNLVSLAVLAVVTALVLITKFYPPIKGAYSYSWFIGCGAGFLLYVVAVLIARRRTERLREAFVPAGSAGAEAHGGKTTVGGNGS